VKKRKQRAEGGDHGRPDPPVGRDPFINAEIRDEEAARGLSVTFPGGVVARASTREEVSLLVELMRALA
jgi:hypothetical protein